MKKILRILLILIILGLWLFYITKNPKLNISQSISKDIWLEKLLKWEDTVEIYTMDLTNCISYFDGCNTCGVLNWDTTCTEMYCETPSEAKCLEYSTGSE